MPQVGFKHSEKSRRIARTTEQRERIADAIKGRKHSPETIELMRSNSSSNPHVLAGKARKIECVDTGEVFPSIRAAAKSLGVSDGAIYASIRRDGFCQGKKFRHVD